MTQPAQRNFDPASIGWEDGELKPVSEMSLRPDSPAVTCGRGLFETLVIRHGRIYDLDRHLNRLESAAPKIGIDVPTRTALRDALLNVGMKAWSGSNQVGPLWLKLLAAAGGRCWVFGGSVAVDPADRPAKLITLPWRRNPSDPLSGLKTLNYAANEVAWDWAAARGADEGAWRNIKGHLAEGCRSNLLLARGGALYVPKPGEGILVGTVLEHLLRAATEASIPVHRGRIRMKSVLRADEAMMTSSIGAVRPIVEWDGRPLHGGKPGALTRALAASVERMRFEGAQILPTGR